MLISIWAPSCANRYGTGRCQKSSQMQMPEAHAEPRVDGADLGTGPEKASLVEEAVVGQVRLAIDVAELTVLEHGRGDVQLMIG